MSLEQAHQQLEVLNEEILLLKADSLECEKKRQQNREALCSLRSSNSKKDTWFLCGDLFFHFFSSTTKEFLEEEKVNLSKQIERNTQTIKEKIKLSEKIEDIPSIASQFNLKPLKPEKILPFLGK